MYRILQILLQNIITHAMADRVSVSFSMVGNALIFKTKDDGIGFIRKNVKAGLGLRNVFLRAKSMNASVSINSAPNQGTSTVIEIPLG